ncbi:MAG TPA: TIGR00730 family Rossman fold protein [Nitrospirales bacterium]|nr:TIGR00730 family Rossman fold protein [Nitrospirales bacterium]
MSLPENPILETPSGLNHSGKKNILEEEIVREIKALWTGPLTDVRMALLKEMVGSVVKLRDLDTDVLDVKILHRTLKELRYAFRVFRQYRGVKKVSIFGSARTRADEPNYKLAAQFGKLLSQRGFMVITGGGPGIMLAGNEGAGREHSFGVNIMLPFEQAPNALIADDKKLVHLKYFFTRKLLLVKETHAVALFPGGFGTLDEAFEVLTLIQTGKTDPIPVVCIEHPGGDYWQRMMEFLERQLLSRGFINRSDLALFKVVYSAEEAVEEIQKFFRVYHSLRIVKDMMVIRIQQQLSQAELTQLNQEFSDLLVDGQFQQVEPLPEEWDEPHISHLPRLVLHYNWKELGRLRQCIDWLNARAMVA